MAHSVCDGALFWNPESGIAELELGLFPSDRHAGTPFHMEHPTLVLSGTEWVPALAGYIRSLSVASGPVKNTD
jgi:hypothetical protein